MVFVALSLWMGIGCLGNRQIKQVSSITATTEIDSMSGLLQSEHRYVRLATVDKLHTTPLSEQSKRELSGPLLELVYNDDEWCPIRGRASRVLGEWKSQEATDGIIDAMASCDDESRYWMLLGLESLSTIDPIALGAIQALVYDTDIFIRSEASKWLEGQ